MNPAPPVTSTRFRLMRAPPPTQPAGALPGTSRHRARRPGPPTPPWGARGSHSERYRDKPYCCCSRWQRKRADSSTGKAGLARSSELPLDRVDRTALDVPLDPAQVLADESQDEALDAEHEEHGNAAEERAGEVRLVDPERDPVRAECGRAERADDAERDAGPLDRLRPEPGEHVQREPCQPQRPVARRLAAGRVL